VAKLGAGLALEYANAYTPFTPLFDVVRMILTCPSCRTRYLVDPTALGADGRQVRCARCAHTWHERPPADMPKRIDVVEPTPRPRPIPKGSNLPAVRGRQRPTNWIGWAALAVIVAAVVGFGVIGREQIVAAWPPSAKLYEMVRLPVAAPRPGLELMNVRSSRGSEDGVQVLIVEGEVVNPSGELQDVPKVRVALRDGDRREIEHLVISTAKPRLRPGEKTNFQTRFERPPADATGLRVRFEGGN
jgi:predicted Zn finger-like uncharacterized protein